MTAVILTKLDSIGGFVCQLVACCRRVLRALRSQVALRQARAVKGASPQVQQVHRSAVLMDATVLRLWRCSNIYLFVWRFCSPTPVVQCFLAGLTALRHKRLFILIHYFQLSTYNRKCYIHFHYFVCFTNNFKATKYAVPFIIGR